MADNKVNFLRGTSAEYEAKTKDNDTFYYTTDTKKLYLGENEVGNGIDPKVIQAHIDNQTIHAKVWRGTQEEYNAIEPKEDDTVYIIKDSDNTLADKLIDDTSTTATDKTWSAKKINENDEVAKTAINTHAGNDEIHVTAAEKASWNGKAELSDIPDKLPADGGNAATAITLSDWSGGVIENADDAPLGLSKIDAGSANNPFKFWAEILTLGETGNQTYRQQWAFPWSNSEAQLKPKYRVKDSGEWGPWQKLNDGGNADKAKQVTCEGIIGTSDSCAYKTILDWANHYTNQGCAAWAFIVSGYGFPEDIPKQFEASVKIESDETGDRKIVTCTEYGTINSSYTRTIYNKSWYNEWQRTSDGGNAASVGAYTEAKIAALEARIAALEGGNV